MKSLSSLHILSNRSTGPGTRGKRPPTWWIPVGILIGFCALFLFLFGDRLLPAPEVAVARVLATPAEAQAAITVTSTDPGSPRFQASGWIEPAPLPIKATALIDGVVDKVHVLPGDTVKEGQTLATLIADDAKLALDAANHRHRTREAALNAHLSAVIAAEKKTESISAELDAAKARLAEAEDHAHRMARMPKGSVPESDVIAAKLNLDREIAQTEAASASVGEMRAELDRLRAETEVKRSEAATAAVEVEQATLNLKRTEITSPIDGRILRLLASPGQKKMLGMDDPDSSTIAILYQPHQLQVRVDVPLADAAGLRIGQSARIHCSLLPDTALQGKVTHITGEADLQRNTLQAKVLISEPPEQLRPEMLCRVEFLESRTSSAGTPAHASSLAVWIPESSLTDNEVWICDPESGRVHKRKVTPATETRDDHILIKEGLRPGEWVVLAPRDLREDKRINPTLSTP